MAFASALLLLTSSALGLEAGIDRVVVYHFNHTTLCNTCLRIQALTAEALQRSFPDLLENCTVQWRPINVDLPENSHFVADYQLQHSEVVVVRFRNGKQVDWKKATGIQELVHDRWKFMIAVRKEVERLLPPMEAPAEREH